MLYFTITSITFQTPKRVEMARVVPADLKPCYLSKNTFFFFYNFSIFYNWLIPAKCQPKCQNKIKMAKSVTKIPVWAKIGPEVYISGIIRSQHFPFLAVF